MYKSNSLSSQKLCQVRLVRVCEWLWLFSVTPSTWGRWGTRILKPGYISEQMPIGGYSTKSVGNITERLMNQHVKQLSFFRDKTVYFASTPNWMDDNRFVVILMDESITSHLVWAFQRDSEFTEFFNYNLNWLKEKGVFYKEYTRREYKVNKGRELIACS